MKKQENLDRKNDEKIIKKEVEKTIKQSKFDIKKLRSDFIEMLYFRKEEDLAINIFIDALYNFYSFKAIANDTCTELMVYDKRLGVYKPNGKSVIKSFFGKTISVYRGNGGDRILNKIISKVAHSNYISFDDYYHLKNPELLVVGNGILNIDTQKLKPYSDKKIQRIRLKWNYNPEAKTDKIEKFFNSMMDEKSVLLLQEFLGHTLFKEYKFQKFLIFEGKGANGKSVLLKLLRYFFDYENYTGFSISDFANISPDHFMFAELFDKLINLGGDTGTSVFSDSSLIKRLTGDDIINANRKFLTSIKFSNSSKFISSFNELPETFDTTDGFWRRVEFIEFPYTFVSKNVYDKKSKDEKKYCKVENKKILNNLLNKESMEALLKWIVDGYVRLTEQGEFTENYSKQELRRRWLHKSNSFEGFIDEHCEFDDGWYVTDILKKELRNQYQQYCNDNKLRVQGPKAIKKSLIERKVRTIQKNNNSKNSKDTYYWSGMKIRETSPYYCEYEDNS